LVRRQSRPRSIWPETTSRLIAISQPKLTPWSPQGFQFVAETGIARPKGTGRALIYSRRARGKRSSRNQISQPKRVTRPLCPKPESDGTRDLSKLAVIGRSGHLTPLRDASGHINRGPTTDLFDPFDALPIDRRGDSHYILTQCKSGVCSDRSTLFP
jgi:hypothetical protein